MLGVRPESWAQIIPNSSELLFTLYRLYLSVLDYYSAQ